MSAFTRFAAALLLTLFALPLAAQEVIRNFETAIVVRPDASVTITERITVNAEGNAIRRGIFRDVPTVLLGANGQRQHSELTVISVTRDGRAEPYGLESIRDGQRIRIGDADVFLARGTHIYEIRYSMDRAARMFETHDELYWNATGNFWQFPIQRATTIVTLPDGARIADLNVFTGMQGATGANATAERLSDTQARFTLTSPLGAYEGMTVAVAFGKGILVAPEGMDAFWYWISDNRNTVIPGLLVLLALAYNFGAWMLVGRDPARGTIFPRFHPPKGFSPALVHYVHRMGWPNNGWLAFSAALVSLATKGLIEIDKDKSKTVLRTTGKTPEQPLPPGEAVIHAFLDGQRSLTIDTASGPALNTTRTSFIQTLETENRAVYFNNHVVFVVFGVILAIASLAVMALVGVIGVEFVGAGMFAAVFLSIFITAMRSLWQGSVFHKFIAFGVIGFVTVNLGVILIGDLGVDWLSFPLIATISIITITLVFGILMRAPTVHGRKIMDEIDGFRMYLETAEKERLNFRGEPDMTVQRFERILPYAMALGVEKPWSERFQNDLARNAVADARGGYTPRWYGDRSFSPSKLASTMGGVASGLSSAMVAAQPSSSSSSGFSGGGGSSGGGGGGGGGGGW